MRTIKKIIITISKKNKDLPAYIFYQNNTEIQKSFHLDTETTEQAKEFLKIISGKMRRCNICAICDTFK